MHCSATSTESLQWGSQPLVSSGWHPDTLFPFPCFLSIDIGDPTKVELRALRVHMKRRPLDTSFSAKVINRRWCVFSYPWRRSSLGVPWSSHGSMPHTLYIDPQLPTPYFTIYASRLLMKGTRSI